MQVKTQGRIFLHVPARGFKEICQVLLARQSISVLLPLFWSGTSTVYFYQTFESESTSSLSSSSRYSNHNIPGGHVILSKSVGEILVYKDTIILLMQELGFVIRDMNPLRICEIA